MEGYTKMNIPPLDVSVTKAATNGHIVDVIKYEDYSKDPEKYRDSNNAAVLFNHKGKDLLLPVRGRYSANVSLPGVYNAGSIDFVVYPDEAFADRYVPKQFVSMSNNDDIEKLIKNGEAIRKLDEPFITSPDEVTCIPIRQSDQPEMKGLKEALNAKKIDIDKYAPRFGQNFPNDKRQLRNNSATIKIIKRFCENCDMEALLIFKDKSPDVPNPIGKEIVISLTETSSGEPENELALCDLLEDEDDESSEYVDD